MEGDINQPLTVIHQSLAPFCGPYTGCAKYGFLLLLCLDRYSVLACWFKLNPRCHVSWAKEDLFFWWAHLSRAEPVSLIVPVIHPQQPTPNLQPRKRPTARSKIGRGGHTLTVSHSVPITTCHKASAASKRTETTPCLLHQAGILSNRGCYPNCIKPGTLEPQARVRCGHQGTRISLTQPGTSCSSPQVALCVFRSLVTQTRYVPVSLSLPVGSA